MRGTILYLDDEEPCLELFRLMFGEEYDVRTARTSAEARASLASRTADIVVSDQSMPDMKGTEFLREVAERHPASCRVLLTGTVTLSGVIRQIGDGLVQFFLTKPWTEAEMLEVFERASVYLESRRWRGKASSW